ncbi:hypothetical protein BK011_04565 [Tenericutes bacterium MZ-XQ]|nr:hypothetical protein BK011_04565 [Tenericutes bacterium MZ-XQ]
MSIAIYGRVSTDKQIADGFGLDVQRKELITEAESKGLEYLEYIDMGITGTSMKKRKELQRLLEDIEEGKIKEVWVTKLSRLGRNTRDVLNIIYEFEKHNVVFKSLRDGIDTSNSMGKIMLQFMSIVSEMERDIIIETTKAGLDYRASLGKIYGCAPVLGYDRIGSGKTSYLEINEKEAKIIKLIFNLYLKGNGYKAICNELNSKGRLTKKGTYFSINTVKNILSNPLYVGMIRYNLFKDWSTKRRKGMQSKDDLILVEGLHKNIISKSKWAKVQKKMKTNKTQRKIRSSNYLLSGLIRCPDCGGLMAGVKGTYKSGYIKNTYYYYVCSTYHNKGRVVCNSNSIDVKRSDEVVIRSLKRFIEELGTYGEINTWNSKMNEILNSEDRMNIKRFLRVLVKKINFDKETKQIMNVEFNFEEDTFASLDIRYSERLRKKLLKCFEDFDIIY